MKIDTDKKGKNKKMVEKKVKIIICEKIIKVPFVGKNESNFGNSLGTSVVLLNFAFKKNEFLLL